MLAFSTFRDVLDSNQFTDIRFWWKNIKKMSDYSDWGSSLSLGLFIELLLRFSGGNRGPVGRCQLTAERRSPI